MKTENKKTKFSNATAIKYKPSTGSLILFLGDTAVCCNIDDVLSEISRVRELQKKNNLQKKLAA